MSQRNPMIGPIFPAMHPASIPVAQRGSVTQRRQQDARDRANTRKILKGHATIQARMVEDAMGSGGLPTVGQIEARKAKRSSVPTIAEFTARKYGRRGK